MKFVREASTSIWPNALASSSQLDDFRSLCEAADTRLFTEILHNDCHVLQALLHHHTHTHRYNLWDRPHNRQLPDRMSHLTNCNFIVRMLFCDSYWLYWLYSLFKFLSSCTVFYQCLHVCLQLRSDTIVLLKRHLIWFESTFTCTTVYYSAEPHCIQSNDGFDWLLLLLLLLLLKRNCFKWRLTIKTVTGAPVTKSLGLTYSLNCYACRVDFNVCPDNKQGTRLSLRDCDSAAHYTGG